MDRSRFSKIYSIKDMEVLLTNTLVPVEPSDQFVKKLRGSLIHVQGRKPFSLWTGLAVGASLLLVVAMSLGVVLRFILAGVGFVNLLLQRRSYRKPSRQARGGSIPLSM
ncbi:MAG: hypothetical protein JXA25_15610 [Anaerolineales bacterium]|nr:hypothetical protein [Anaerolineales bacterium]